MYLISWFWLAALGLSILISKRRDLDQILSKVLWISNSVNWTINKCYNIRKQNSNRREITRVWVIRRSSMLEVGTRKLCVGWINRRVREQHKWCTEAAMTTDEKGAYWEATRNKVGYSPGTHFQLVEGLRRLRFKLNNCSKKWHSSKII